MKNPWDSTRLLHRYILLPDSVSVPDALPEGTLVRTPLKNSLVYSGVHAGAIRELGAIDAVKGVADAAYFTMAEIGEGLRDGSVTDVGSSMSPDVEKVTLLGPDAILASPYQNSGSSASFTDAALRPTVFTGTSRMTIPDLPRVLRQSLCVPK